MTQTAAPTGRQLRDYQQEAVDKIYAEWDNGIQRTVIVHATGLGKTDIIAKIATDEVRNGGRVLLLAHRAEPLNQMSKRCLMYAPDITIGRVQANRNEVNAQIIVASVQTLCRDKRMAQINPETITVVIIDETHHALASSYDKIVTWAGCYEPDGACLLGVTATLIRGDGQQFDGLFSSVADVRGIDWAIEHGWLVEPHGRSVRLRNMVLDAVKVIAGDYSAKALSPYITQDAHRIVKAWLREADNRITAAFAPTVASATALRDAFLAAGITAELVVGTTPHEERALTYKRLAIGQTRVLVNVAVATEAWDCPPVSCVLIARPTQSSGLYAQMVGRGLRLSPETGKTDCLVLDVVGASRRHQLVTLVDMYTRRGRGSAARSTGRSQAPKWWHRTRYDDVDMLPAKSLTSRVIGWMFGKDN